MWKVVAFVLAVFVLGHFAVRYVRKNPLAPVAEGAEVVVESPDYRVRLERNGAVEGTYFIASAASEDWGRRPLNARLRVFGLQGGSEFMRAYSDFHLYGTPNSERLVNVSTPLALIAARRDTYGLLRALLDRYRDREASGGERLCVTLTGEALSIAAAESLEDGADATAVVASSNADEPIVYVDDLEVVDCSRMLAKR